jgi:hypothetical protein
MKIRTGFYYRKMGSNFLYGGTMVIADRKLVHLGDLPIEEKGKAFYYNDTCYTISYENSEAKRVLEANRIITEASYGKSQQEYLVKLNWCQQQKLLWMFNQHWLQQSGNMIHLIVLGLIISLAIFSFELIHHKF